MTWEKLYEEVRKQCSHPQHADNIVGELMDDAGDYDWDHEAPEWAVSVLKA